MRPWSEKVRDVPGGFLIPILIMIIISFPPLFGHEIVGVLCGIVYGLWVGFGIVAAGTFFGEGRVAGTLSLSPPWVASASLTRHTHSGHVVRVQGPPPH